MILAAGLGPGMRPFTGTLPKPLTPVLGRPLIDHTLDHLAAHGVTDVVANLHYLRAPLAAHFAQRSTPRITPVIEAEILGTGGGVRNALPSLGDAPFFVINADILWRNAMTPALARLEAAWDQARMDALLLVHPVVAAHGYTGAGDFLVDPTGTVHTPLPHQVAPFLFTGVQIVAPSLFTDAPSGAFAMNIVWRRAEAAGRLYAIVHDGDWRHLNAPGDAHEIEASLRSVSFWQRPYGGS
jgi:N-acetyl-alpha-D-muramate 1-phosphate uridylyltransferase